MIIACRYLLVRVSVGGKGLWLTVEAVRFRALGFRAFGCRVRVDCQTLLRGEVSYGLSVLPTIDVRASA